MISIGYLAAGDLHFGIVPAVKKGKLKDLKEKVEEKRRRENNVPPVINVSQQLFGAPVSGLYLITLEVTDDISVKKVEFYLDNVLIYTDTVFPYEYGWDTSSATEGEHEIKIIAYDFYDIQTERLFSCIVDNDPPPTVAISSPTALSVLAGVALITAIATDNGGISKVELYVEGIYEGKDTVAPFVINWDTTKNSEGNNSVTALAYDNKGQTKDISREYIVDNIDEKPSVSITNPSASIYVADTINISASATDDRGIDNITCYIDFAGIGTDTTSPYEFSWNTTLSTKGTHTILAVATDTGANTDQKSIIVTVDNDDPTVTLTSPANGVYTSGSFNITANASDEFVITKVEFRVDNAVKANDTEFPYSYSLDSSQYSDGSHKLSVYSYDANNRSAESFVNVFFDNTAPSVVISTPIANQIVDGQGTIKTTFSDVNGINNVKIYIDDNLIHNENNPAQSTITKQWDTTSYSNGNHDIKVTATDNAGKSKTVVNSVIVNNSDWIIERISDIGTDYFFTMVDWEIDSNDNIHMIAKSSGERILYFKYSGGSWSEEVVETETDNINSLFLRLSSNDEPYILYSTVNDRRVVLLKILSYLESNVIEAGGETEDIYGFDLTSNDELNYIELDYEFISQPNQQYEYLLTSGTVGDISKSVAWDKTSLGVPNKLFNIGLELINDQINLLYTERIDDITAYRTYISTYWKTNFSVQELVDGDDAVMESKIAGSNDLSIFYTDNADNLYYGHWNGVALSTALVISDYDIHYARDFGFCRDGSGGYDIVFQDHNLNNFYYSSYKGGVATTEIILATGNEIHSGVLRLNDGTLFIIYYNETTDELYYAKEK